MRYLRFVRRGQSIVEYAALIAALAIAITAAVTTVRGRVQSSFEKAGDKIDEETNYIFR
jgi:Flp pilus assembly pilin Flp